MHPTIDAGGALPGPRPGPPLLPRNERARRWWMHAGRPPDSTALTQSCQTITATATPSPNVAVGVTPHARDPPYLHSSVAARVRCGADVVPVAWVRACLNLLPVPDSCRVLRGAGGSGSAQRPRSGAAGVLDTIARERIMPGGRAGSPVMADVVQRVRVLALSVRVTSCDGRGRGREQPALPGSAGR
jgi:hypothetical protein